MSGLPYPRVKSPLVSKGHEAGPETVCPCRPARSLFTAEQCTLVAILVKFQTVPQWRAALQFGLSEQATTLGRKGAQVQAMTNSQSITYQWRFGAFRKQTTAGVRNDLRRRIGIYFRMYSNLVCLVTCSYIRIKSGIDVN
jgi:hypothetical protein